VKTSDIIISLIQEELEKKLNEQSVGRKLWIFDFDDTLVTSESQVIVKDAEGNVIEKIDTADYPTHTLEPGQEYDYSEFSKVIDPERIEGVFKTFVEQINDSNSEVYILTARQPASTEAIFNYLLEKENVKFDKENIIAVGSSDPQAKVEYIIQWILEHKPSEVHYFDDANKNLFAFKKAINQIYDEIADDKSTEEYKEAFEGLYDKIFVVDPQGGGGEPIAEARKKKKKKKSKKRRKSSRSKYFGRFFYPMAGGFYGDYSSAGSAGIADGGGDGGGGGE
jgi:hypothetical protein